MSPHHGVSLLEWDGGDTLVKRRPSAHNLAILEELKFVHREAQAEACLAYEDWRRLRSGDAYAVYRAAQDRADAAQDDLARLSGRIAA